MQLRHSITLETSSTMFGQYYKVLHSTVLLHTTKYNTVLIRTTKCYSVLRSTTKYDSVLHSTTTDYYSILQSTTLYHKVLHNTTPYYTVLLRTTKYYTVPGYAGLPANPVPDRDRPRTGPNPRHSSWVHTSISYILIPFGQVLASNHFNSIILIFWFGDLDYFWTGFGCQRLKK